MSPEERQLLTALFERVKTASATPRDREAEALIDESVRSQPYAPYYLAQAVVVQEKGLEAASKRITELEARVRELEARGPAPQPEQEQRGGFLSSIFGSSQPPQQQQRPAAPVPQQTAAPSGPWGSPRPDYNQPPQQNYNDDYRYRAPAQPTGPWTAQPAGPSAGSSFLTGALGTAAGVAGGMLLANTLSNAFSSHVSGSGWGNPLEGAFGGHAASAAAAAPVEETTIINNYYGNDPNQANAPQDAGFQQADYDNDDDVGGWDDSQDDSGDDSSYA